eukprot:gnl/MRDRNA2_/MRDRNA2_210039_c0_seq1.p1 gnl/MRDRNA2_/MRDRNA2_210039_c0~~gnl/MRDRNA2_/MRDRNA2_210039_c0_seq1.p1  ORF type:complete len:316 (+),score=39.15 gnl/MRDRNA2_/MRDRNA2_210039_c0_seq1:49-948(+)
MAYYVFNQDATWHDTLFGQFGLLFVADYPGEPAEDVPTRIITYLGLLVFTIGLLNIFIGVIGEAYALEKSRVHLTLRAERCQAILTFLLRDIVIPKIPDTPKVRVGVEILVALLVCMMVFIQFILITGLSEQSRFFAAPVFGVSMLLMDFSVFQLSQGPWVKHVKPKKEKDEHFTKAEEDEHFIWIGVPLQEQEQADNHCLITKMKNLTDKFGRLETRLLERAQGPSSRSWPNRRNNGTVYSGHGSATPSMYANMSPGTKTRASSFNPVMGKEKSSNSTKSTKTYASRVGFARKVSMVK